MPEDTVRAGPCRMDRPHYRIRRPHMHPFTTSQTQTCANDANNGRNRRILLSFIEAKHNFMFHSISLLT